MTGSAVEVLLEPLRQIDGFAFACLVNASTGLILGSVHDRDEANVPVAAAGATDIANVVSLMIGHMPGGGDMEDVIVTFSSRYHLIRPLQEPGRQLLMLVVLERPRANLAMARREIRDVGLSIER